MVSKELLDKVNLVFKDEQTRKPVRLMLADERLKNTALSWMGLPPEKRADGRPYQKMIIREFEARLLKN